MTHDTDLPQGYKATALGIIPQEWEVKFLGDLLSRCTNGLTYDVSITCGIPVTRIETISTGEINYAKVGYIPNESGYETFRMQKGDILYSHINSLSQIGKVAYYKGDQEIYHGMNLLLLRANDCLDKQYLYYTLLTEHMRHMAQVIAKPAVNQASISTSDLKRVKIAVPPLAEQRKIAEVLRVWDEAIEKQARLIEKLALRKRGLMQRLLSAKLRLPGFSDPWKELKINKITIIRKGEQVNKDVLFSNAKYPVINGGITPSGYLDIYNTKANTITISEGGNSCDYVNFMTTPFWSGGHCYTIEAKDGINNLCIYQLLKNNEKYIMSLRVGSGLPNIQIKDLGNLKFMIPTYQEQTAIAEVLTASDREIELAKEKLERLRRQKRGLMQQLLTGKKRVKY